MRRNNSYEQMLAIGTQARERLAERGDVYDSQRALARLDDRLQQLGARAGLPQRKLSRARPVLAELFSGRYHRYANGIYSAAKDLFGLRPD